MRLFISLLLSLVVTNARAVSEPVCDWEVLRRIDHDSAAFTQGLDVVGDIIYESTGLYGESSVRHLNLTTGKVSKKINLDQEYFGEGLVIMDEELFLVTWREETGMVFDRDSLELKRTFTYKGEGWGLSSDGSLLIMSNGSSELQFIDPESAKVLRTVQVMSEHGPVTQLNELEFVDGSIYANIWQSEVIVKIDPANGKVLGWLDMSGLLGPRKLPGVLNGIASLDSNNRLLLTGKNWPSLFEIQVNCEG